MKNFRDSIEKDKAHITSIDSSNIIANMKKFVEKYLNNIDYLYILLSRFDLYNHLKSNDIIMNTPLITGRTE